MAKEEQKKDQSKKQSGEKSQKPDWVDIIEKNSDDLTKHMYALFKNGMLKTNFEEELEKEKKRSK